MSRRALFWAAVGIYVVCCVAPAAAVSLFAAPASGLRTRSALVGVHGVRLLTLNRDALATLRHTSTAVLDEFPLGANDTATIELTRFDPFPAQARVEIVEPTQVRTLALPDRTYFSGRVRGDPASRVLVIASADAVEGFVATQGDVYPFGPDAHGRHRSYALTQADPTVYPPPRDFCANDLEPAAIAHPTAMHAAPLQVPATAAASGAPLRLADLAIETDSELRAKFSTDDAAVAYLTSLLAASTAIYERDVNVRLQYSYLRLWGAGTTDPWTATTTSAALGELMNYWNDATNNMATIAGPHDLVHFLSGKPVRGGIAYLDVLCDQNYGYGVSQVYGSFDLSNPSAIWDLVVFTHELGHNFGSPHSHCYSPPLDHCYGSESGCYAGATEASHGNLMSYCHLQTGGLSNIDLTFGDTVSQRIRDTVQGAACLALVGSSTTTSSTTTTTTTRTTTTSTTTTSTTTTTRTTTTTTPGTPPSTSTTTSTTLTTTSTTTPATESTTSTTTTADTTTTTHIPDRDADGVPDVADLCPATSPHELVDTSGCPVCPCTATGSGQPWRSHGQYLRCVRGAIALRSQALGGDAVRAALRHAQQSTCGRRGVTRCCVSTGDGVIENCRLLRSTSCSLRAASDSGHDLGSGSCLPSPCATD